MRLLKVKLEGIRRFEKTDALLVADRLVAIVGPNEAGKTSLLRALDQVDRIEEPLPATMATRQCSVSPAIRALFELDTADRDAIADIHDAHDVARCWVVRTTSGTRWRLERSPKRDLAPRRSIKAALGTLEGDVAVDSAFDDPDQPLSSDDWDTAEATSGLDTDSLSDEQRAALQRLADQLEFVAEPEADPDDVDGDEGERARAGSERENRGLARKAVVQTLRDVVALESQPSPFSRVISILRQRLPTIIEFDDEDRDLRTEYDLQEIGDSPPPAALANVASLAELDLGALRQAIEAGDHGTVRLVRENANRRLEEVFNESYGQSDVCLQLDTDGFLLRLLVRSEGGEDFIELSERSAGFRWFVALVAFLAHRRYERPLVLIDEIETHLHYVAQADVIDVLTRQTIADQVIYTTHSAGALPPDLGRGVRAVVPVAGRQRSEISNSFWTSGPGFTPLLFGLGASTLPFSIPRHLVVAEGASDAVLLPSLIREASGVDELPYRIAPGIANTPAEDLRKLDDEGGRVVYLVDGDDGGHAHRENLLAAGIDGARIIDLATVGGDGFTPEDGVVLDLLMEAVNREGEPFWNGQRPTAEGLPDTGRSKAIEDWCKDENLPSVSKVRVAQAIVEASWGPLADEADGEGGRQILSSEEGRRSLARLHQLVLGALGLESQGAS